MTGVSRRGFCRIGSVGSLALAGASLEIGSIVGSAVAEGEDTEDDHNGRVVFIYDDSWREDWTDTFPVHQDEGVPACCAAVTDYVDTGWGLLPEHLREMEAEGWEIMSHTASHGAVGNLYLREAAEPGDEKVYLNGDFLENREDAEIVISDGDRTVENVIAGGGSDDTGTYIDLEEPVGDSFEPENSFARFSDEIVHEEVVGSKEELEEMGFEIDHFVSPFGRSEGLVDELVQEHYAGFANRGGDGLNPVNGLDPHELGRTSIDGNVQGREEIEEFYDEVVAGEYLGIVVGHSQFDETTPERVRFAIQEAKARDLEIVTLREALTDLGHGRANGSGAGGKNESADESEGGSETGGDGTEADDSASDDSPSNESATAGERATSAVQDNRTSILAGTGILAAVGAAGAAAYRRLDR
ncbi:polysaccharide deacetylase family protein [Halostagnicola sp. A-GB9-2]|uniref:polysaccharide deacetylase family protein n=1 Tax=Halostagnicola sp. A-GB9-2 TaxID=3048066 RepID=UPI0024BF3BAE|nr:polysaccharide deacetylase family protein [Halostagnicola sp. A-GB9-2]MDJ1432094.1 polysaccharide deacetylase family protein [Halostagnicola sp. A-GB9-2]